MAPSRSRAQRRSRRARRLHLMLTALVPTLLSLARPRALVAQSVDSVPADSAVVHCRRCLGGHRFLVSSLVPDPFITTHFRTGTGGGAASNLTVAEKNLDGEVTDSIGGTIGFLVLDFEYQYAINRWLAARGMVTAAARTGTNSATLLAGGATALYGSNLGLTARVWGNDAAQVAVTADVARNQLWTIDPFGFAKALVENGFTDSTQAALIRAVTTNRAIGGVRGAWAPRPWLGLNAVVEGGAAENPRTGRGTKALTQLGVLSSFDLNPLWHVPVGLLLGYRAQSGPGRTADIAGTAGSYTLGVLYSGRPNYLVGVDATWSHIDVNAAGVNDFSAIQLRLVSRFDF
jgi:hypothetical protein